MPMYEYVCNDCGTKLELLQNRGAQAPACEHCGKQLTRSVSLSSFVLKGGGWYKSDYCKPCEASGSCGCSEGKACPHA